MPYQSIRGVNHYYEWITADRSSTPSPQKPVMVFLHGWAGSCRYWQTTAEALTPWFDCLLYDMRGFGRSPLPNPVPDAVVGLGYELESYADDLALLLDALELRQPVYLNAHSMGASIATLFLNRYGDRIAQAVLTCSGIFEYDKRAFEAFYTFGGYVVKFRPPWLGKIPLVHRMFMARFLHRLIPSRESRAFLDDFLMADYAAAIGTIYTSVSKTATEVMPREFQQLQTRTLLVSGQYDQIIPEVMGRAAADLSPQVTQVVIPRTAHFPMLEDAKTYLQVVKAFLDLPDSGDRTPVGAQSSLVG